jgi:HEAT repeats
MRRRFPIATVTTAGLLLAGLFTYALVRWADLEVVLRLFQVRRDPSRVLEFIASEEGTPKRKSIERLAGSPEAEVLLDGLLGVLERLLGEERRGLLTGAERGALEINAGGLILYAVPEDPGQRSWTWNQVKARCGARSRDVQVLAHLLDRAGRPLFPSKGRGLGFRVLPGGAALQLIVSGKVFLAGGATSAEARSFLFLRNRPGLVRESLEKLKAPAARDRDAAVGGLLSLALFDPEVVPALIEVLAAGDPGVHSTIWNGFALLGPSAVDPLTTALRDPRPSIRLEAIQALCALGAAAAPAQGALRAMADDPGEDGELRRTAEQALAAVQER